MTPEEMRARIVHMERIVRFLLARTDLHDIRDELLDSLQEQATGDAQMGFLADEMRERVDGTGAKTAGQMHQDVERRKKRLQELFASRQ